jgi:hypothetical protein
MGAHMKTTIEISDALLSEARRLAEKQGTTMRRLVEEGLPGKPRASGAGRPSHSRRRSRC